MKKTIQVMHILSLILLGMMFIACSSPVTTTATTPRTPYYVSVNGNDTNTGNEGSPFATVQKAIDTIIEASTVSGNAYYEVIVNGDIQQMGTSIGIADTAMVNVNPANKNQELNIEFKGSTSYRVDHIDASASRDDGVDKRVLYINGPKVTVVLGDKLTLTGGKEVEGGAVLVENGANLIVSGAHVEDNEATYGGAIYARNAKIFLESGSLQKNTGNERGGAVYLDSGTLFTMTGGTINENLDARYGGGVYVASGATFNVQGGQIGKNTADNGAGVYINIDGTLNLRGSPHIISNLSNNRDNNVEYEHISYSERGNIHITGALDIDAEVGITCHGSGDTDVIIRNNKEDYTNNSGLGDDLITIPNYVIQPSDVEKLFKDSMAGDLHNATLDVFFSLENNNLEYK